MAPPFRAPTSTERSRPRHTADTSVPAGKELLFPDGVQQGVGTRTEVIDGRMTGRLDGPFCPSDGKLARLRERST